MVSSSAVVMITWPLSPMLPPPIARRSTPRSASASASVAIAPGSFFSWTTNCLAIDASAVRRRPERRRVTHNPSRRRRRRASASPPAGPTTSPNEPAPEQPGAVQPRIREQRCPSGRENRVLVRQRDGEQGERECQPQAVDGGSRRSARTSAPSATAAGTTASRSDTPARVRGRGCRPRRRAPTAMSARAAARATA